MIPVTGQLGYIIGSASVPYLLVIQYNIWSPDVVGRHMQLLYAPVLVGVPNQFVVVPKLKEETRKISILGRVARSQEGKAAVINFVLLGPYVPLSVVRFSLFLGAPHAPTAKRKEYPSNQATELGQFSRIRYSPIGKCGGERKKVTVSLRMMILVLVGGCNRRR